MKKIAKTLVLFALCSISLMSATSCSKSDDAEVITYYYKYFGVDEMYYITSEETTAIQFFTELGSIMTKYDGTNFTDSNLVTDINKVVTKYDKGVIRGTFYLKKSLSEDGPWSTVKSWTMNFSSKYTKADNCDMTHFPNFPE